MLKGKSNYFDSLTLDFDSLSRCCFFFVLLARDLLASLARSFNRKALNFHLLIQIELISEAVEKSLPARNQKCLKHR
jgi:hypothetical protein